MIIWIHQLIVLDIIWSCQKVVWFYLNMEHKVILLRLEWSLLNYFFPSVFYERSLKVLHFPSFLSLSDPLLKAHPSSGRLKWRGNIHSLIVPGEHHTWQLHIIHVDAFISQSTMLHPKMLLIKELPLHTLYLQVVAWCVSHIKHQCNIIEPVNGEAVCC